LEQAIAANQDKLELYLSLATLHDALEHPEDGLKLLLEAESRFSSDAKYHFRIGVLYDKLGKRPQSIERMKRVVVLNPDDAQAHNYLGYTYAEMGINLEEALSHVKRALENRPDDGFFIDSLGWVYYQMKRYHDAVRYLEKAASLVTDDPAILEHLGDAHFALKEKKQALKYYKKARVLDPKKKELDEKIKRILQGELEEK
jgi:tetratricopeptide (TPR) repeat protein